MAGLQLQLAQAGVTPVEASLGVLLLRAAYSSPEGALPAVDRTCFPARRAGRNRLQVYAADVPGTTA